MKNTVRYRIRHETAYEYRNDVVHSHQLLHLVPRPTAYQQCLEHVINVAPAFYRKRNEIERLFRRLKGFRRIFSRFDKLDLVFIAFIYFALVVEALR